MVQTRSTSVVARSARTPGASSPAPVSVAGSDGKGLMSAAERDLQLRQDDDVSPEDEQTDLYKQLTGKGWIFPNVTEEDFRQEFPVSRAISGAVGGVLTFPTRPSPTSRSSGRSYLRSRSASLL